MEPSRRTIELPSGTVSYLEWEGGGGGASDVLLLHGGGLDSAWLSWERLGSALGDAGHRVIAPDHPGYGHSAASTWVPTHERLVSYLAEFVDALGLRDYIIGGLSMGGAMTIGHLLARPDEPHAAMLFGTYGLMTHQVGGRLGPPLHVVTWMLQRAGMLRAGMRVLSRNRRLMDFSLRRVVNNPGQRTEELVDAVMDEARRGAGIPPFMLWQRDEILWNRFRTNYTDRLGEIRVPVLIVHGARDFTVPVRHARVLAERIPDSRVLIVRDASHWVQRDAPEIVNARVLDFVVEVGRTSRAESDSA